MPLSEAQIEQRRAAGRKGGKIAGAIRAKQFTPQFQRAARRKVSSESCARNGAKGARATIERHGMDTMMEQARRHRLQRPSPLELQVIGILARLKLDYEREFVVCNKRFFTVDFWLPDHRLAIEVHGAIHDPGKPNYRRRLQNDQEKRELLRHQKRRLLMLHHSEFANLGNVIERIRNEVKI